MYQALYRRYRPMRFDDVLGQDHITSTLKNQIENNNIGHAYLFSGTRGTGKTSTAKIFSRAVSCLDPKDSNPCNQCEVCKGILDGSIMDVIEMDAASNRGVNDIRELRDKVVYPPSYARYKVYIIDEVHMLTQEAFNALLKTLEEPPSHLIFILATTEPEKIPQTILSRCQRFDFKRITIKNIIKNLSSICKELGIEASEDALRVIGRNSDGAMRDALSLLDQCISFSQGNITYDDVISILGIVNSDIIFKIVDDILNKDTEDILSSIDKMVQDGRDINQFIKDIINHFRNLMIIKSSQSPMDILDIDKVDLDRYKVQAGKIELDYLLEILEILTGVDQEARLSTHPRILLEMGLIRILRGANLSLEERIRRLEEGIGPRVQQEKPVIKEETPIIKEETPRPKPSLVDRKVREIDRVDEGKVSSPGPSKDLSSIKESWQDIMEVIRQKKPSVAGVLREGYIVGYDNDQLTIEFGKDYGFHMNAANNNLDFIQDLVSKTLNRNTVIRFQMQGISSSNKEEKQELDEEAIKEVVDLFGPDKVKIIKE